jgi:hypothetical protein
MRSSANTDIFASHAWNQKSATDFSTCAGSDSEPQMPFTPAQQALDQARSVAFMRAFYASLGMRKQTLERAISHGKELPGAPPAPVARRPRSPGK